EYDLMIGCRTAEQLKLSLGRAQVGGVEHCEVRGRSLKTGLPASLVISQGEIGHAIVEPLRKIALAVRETLAETPPELAGDIHRRGVILTGGGALLSGMDTMLERDTGLTVRVAEDALDCVVLGALRALNARDDIPDTLYADLTADV
ncbi:MAG: rod shape-determining protein, partial [Clostridia bacterium]|nr:rod shape-determining protein [Clostridia bacterium]